VRVEIAAAAVNFPDVLLVAGTYQIPVPAPSCRSEFAGVVVELGEGSTPSPSATGHGHHPGRAFAEQAWSHPRLTSVPDGVPFAVAGVRRGPPHGLARAAVVAAVQPGRSWSCSAPRGVGLAAVQLGAVLGARSPPSLLGGEARVAASYGASTLIDHRTSELRRRCASCSPGAPTW